MEWRCKGCNSTDDVYKIPVGFKHYDIQLCVKCRRELVRKILDTATS